MAPDPTHRVIDPSVLYLGTPVYLVATQNVDGTTNLAPASSHFALGRMIVLGLEEGGQSLDNVRRHGQITVNFPSALQWQHVERLAGVTGKDPVPADKAEQCVFEPRKFERAGLTPIESDLVDVPRVAEAPIQLEARVHQVTAGAAPNGSESFFGIVEAEVVRVHARSDVTVAGTDHIDPEAWHPLLYAYRHFFDRGAEVGWTRKSPLIEPPEAVARWELSGGTWRVAAVSAESTTAEPSTTVPVTAPPPQAEAPDIELTATVELLRCDGGEVADVLTLTNAREVRWAQVQRAIGENV